MGRKNFIFWTSLKSTGPLQTMGFLMPQGQLPCGWSFFNCLGRGLYWRSRRPIYKNGAAGPGNLNSACADGLSCRGGDGRGRRCGPGYGVVHITRKVAGLLCVGLMLANIVGLKPISAV